MAQEFGEEQVLRLLRPVEDDDAVLAAFDVRLPVEVRLQLHSQLREGLITDGAMLREQVLVGRQIGMGGSQLEQQRIEAMRAIKAQVDELTVKIAADEAELAAALAPEQIAFDDLPEFK